MNGRASVLVTWMENPDILPLAIILNSLLVGDTVHNRRFVLLSSVLITIACKF